MSNIKEQLTTAFDELISQSVFEEGDILVVGCSSSEVLGEKIGTSGSLETAAEIFDVLKSKCDEKGLYLACQCCEHLNRAIITERAAVPYGEIVNVVPQPKAGGSLATQAYAGFDDPVAVEEIKADAGIDIGFTLIGMHLKKVAVPVRLENNRIGEAMIVAARTRPKFIGGARAVYDEKCL